VDVRRNALDAISEALSRGAGSVAAGADAAPAARRHLRQDYALALVERLVPCLSDRDLPTRNAAAKLLGKLTPECVLPPLIQLCADRDARTRSAAAEAVGAVFRLNEPADALRAFLACSASQPSAQAADQARSEEAGAGASTSAAGAGAPDGRDTAVERAVGVLRKWAADVAPAAWPPLIDALLAAMAAAPGDSTLVRVASALGTSMGSGGGSAAHLLARVQALLAAQAVPSSRIVDKDAVFDRLSPLLLLRVLPLDAFEDPLAEAALYGDLPVAADEAGACAPDAPRMCIAAVLLRRMSDEFEPDDVRRISAELAGRLRPSSAWPHVLAQTLRFARGRSWPQLRAAIFAACSAHSVRGTAAVPAGVPPAELLAELTRVLALDPAAPGTDETQLMKTQLGCIDFLAAVAAAQLDVSTRLASVRISEVDAPDSGCGDVLHALLAMVTCAADTLPWSSPGDLVDADALAAVRACCANVIIAAGRYAAGQARLALAQGVLPAISRRVPPVFSLACVRRSRVLRVQGGASRQRAARGAPCGAASAVRDGASHGSACSAIR
jgi:HEAT repeat protein